MSEKTTQIKYVVHKESTLGYFENDSNVLSVLHGSVRKGGYDWRNGPVNVNPNDCREATQADFDEYRVSSRGHL